MVEITVKGPGDFSVGLIDAKGRLLFRKRLVISGDPAIEARSRLPLTVQTRNGALAVVPVLIDRRNGEQQITFAGRPPSEFTAQRCRELKLAPAIVEKTARAAAAAVLRADEVGLSMRVPRA